MLIPRSIYKNIRTKYILDTPHLDLKEKGKDRDLMYNNDLREIDELN